MPRRARYKISRVRKPKRPQSPERERFLSDKIGDLLFRDTRKRYPQRTFLNKFGEVAIYDERRKNTIYRTDGLNIRRRRKK